MSKPVFGYWNIRGLANPTRHLLHYIGIDYEEKLYPLGSDVATGREPWLEQKFKLGLDFPNLPYWIDTKTGVKMTESKAILKHIAREHAPELMPKTNAEHREADMLENVVGDLHLRLVYHAYAFKEENVAFFEQFAKEKFEQLTKFMTGKKWVLGQKMSYVDFLLYDTLYFYKSFKSELLEPYATLQTFMKNFESVPAIAKYMASPNYIKGPCVAPFADKKF